MNYEQMNNNQVELCGTVVKKPEYSHEVYGEGFYETELEVKRLSDQTDILPITISERLLVEYNISEGSFIGIDGQFRSYNKLCGERSKLMLTVFVRDVVDADTIKNSNTIELTGHICKDPVYRVTPFKREICDILLAVNRSYNKSDYIPCITWGRNARYVNGLGVGEKVTIVGRIQSREYQKTDHSGNIETRTAYEVSVSKIICGEEKIQAYQEKEKMAEEIEELS